MKKLFVLLMVVMLALAACNPKETEEVEETVAPVVEATIEPVPVEEFKVGFVSDTGGVFDGSRRSRI